MTAPRNVHRQSRRSHRNRGSRIGLGRVFVAVCRRILMNIRWCLFACKSYYLWNRGHSQRDPLIFERFEPLYRGGGTTRCNAVRAEAISRNQLAAVIIAWLRSSRDTEYYSLSTVLDMPATWSSRVQFRSSKYPREITRSSRFWSTRRVIVTSSTRLSSVRVCTCK